MSWTRIDYLQKQSTSYQKIPEDKKFYVLSNLIKSAVLASITPFALIMLHEAMVQDIWLTNKIRNLGCIYAIPDFVSMILVRRMKWTTIAHHTIVCLFNFASIHNDYAKENVCRLIVVYAIFSTFAYLVNLLLASRFLNVSPNLSFQLSIGALLIYASCCAINWSWQVYYINRLYQVNPGWPLYLYCVLICFVVMDDCVLNKWLCHNARIASVKKE